MKDFKKPLYGDVYIHDFKRSSDGHWAYLALRKVGASYSCDYPDYGGACGKIEFTMEYNRSNVRWLVKEIGKVSFYDGRFVNLHDYESGKTERNGDFDELEKHWNL